MGKASRTKETKNIACWMALPALKDKWNIKYGMEYSIVLRLNLGAVGGSFKMQTHANRGEGACQCKSWRIITRFFVGFIKTTVLLEIYVQ